MQGQLGQERQGLKKFLQNFDIYQSCSTIPKCTVKSQKILPASLEPGPIQGRGPGRDCMHASKFPWDKKCLVDNGSLK